VLGGLLVVISRMPNDNPLKRIMVAVTYGVGATAAPGMLVIPATPIPGLGTAIDIGAPLALLWYWWTFFRKKNTIMNVLLAFAIGHNKDVTLDRANSWRSPAPHSVFLR
jgi:hypothetical protein